LPNVCLSKVYDFTLFRIVTREDIVLSAVVHAWASASASNLVF
jgi:hypothetical protein